MSILKNGEGEWRTARDHWYYVRIVVSDWLSRLSAKINV